MLNKQNIFFIVHDNFNLCIVVLDSTVKMSCPQPYVLSYEASPTELS